MLAVVVLTGLLSACSNQSGSQDAGSTLTIRSGANALSDNAAQADKLIGSGQAAFDERMAALRGHPVVVNQWASWCGSCRFELPFFQSVASKFGDRVAFLGLDSRDNRGSAEDFLNEYPSGFPSVFDDGADVARELGGGRAWPTTFFVDSEGKLVFTKLGAYADQEQLE